MPKFSQSSLDKLITCHPKLQELFNAVITKYDCQILTGHRNQVDQDLAFAQGHSKLKWPNGQHNKLPSLAVDTSPFPVDWSNYKRFYLFAGYVLGVAESMGLKIRWGGAWDDLKDGDIGDLNTPGQLNDLVHFELKE